MKIYTVREISELYKLTEHFIREEIKSGKLKAVSFGCRAGYRITEDDLIAWMNEKRGTITERSKGKHGAKGDEVD